MSKQKDTKVNHRQIIAQIEYREDPNRAYIHFNRNIMLDRPVTVFSEHHENSCYYRIDVHANPNQNDEDMINQIRRVNGISRLSISDRMVGVTKQENKPWGTIMHDVANKVAEYLNAEVKFEPDLRSVHLDE